MANSAKPGGNKQAPTSKPWLKCGEVGTYAELNKKRAKPKFERDHVPSHAAMTQADMRKLLGNPSESDVDVDIWKKDGVEVSVDYTKGGSSLSALSLMLPNAL